MDVNSIYGSAATPSTSQPKSGKGLSALSDYDSFLKLFVTQLKYQDPLSPASQEDFLAQTAQFSSLEQLMSLNTKLGDLALATRTSAASLIGRRVAGNAVGADGTTTETSGIVAQVDYGEKGDLILGLLDGTSLSFGNVTSVAEA